MTLLRNIVYSLFFFLGSALIVVMAMFSAVFGERATIWVSHCWARYAHLCAHLFLGIRTRIEGRIGDTQALYACKHQSFYETSEMLRLLYDPVTIFKEELLRIPGWGWVARKQGVVAIDRGAGAGAVRALLAAAKAMRAGGRSVLIFPEGTRLAPGEAVPLGSGFAGLYKALALPVIPVAVDTGRLWPRKGLKRAGVVTFRFGAAIPSGLPRAELEARVEAAINSLDRPA